MAAAISQAETYQGVVDDMRDSYSCSEEDAHEAARNLIGFCRVLTEIAREKNIEY